MFNVEFFALLIFVGTRNCLRNEISTSYSLVKIIETKKCGSNEANKFSWQNYSMTWKIYVINRFRILPSKFFFLFFVSYPNLTKRLFFLFFFSGLERKKLYIVKTVKEEKNITQRYSKELYESCCWFVGAKTRSLKGEKKTIFGMLELVKWKKIVGFLCVFIAPGMAFFFVRYLSQI